MRTLISAVALALALWSAELSGVEDAADQETRRVAQQGVGCGRRVVWIVGIVRGKAHEIDGGPSAS